MKVKRNPGIKNKFGGVDFLYLLCSVKPQNENTWDLITWPRQ